MRFGVSSAKSRRPFDLATIPTSVTPIVIVAMEKRTKLILNFALGKRDQSTTDAFIEGLRLATSRQKFQITTDGFGPYRSAITTTLHDRCDFAQLIKVYRATPEGERRYSPAEPYRSEACRPAAAHLLR